MAHIGSSRISPPDGIKIVADWLKANKYKIASESTAKVDVLEDVLFLIGESPTDAHDLAALHVYIANLMGSGRQWAERQNNAAVLAPFTQS